MRRTAVTTAATVTGIVSLLALKPHQAARPALSAQSPAAPDPTTGAAAGTTGSSRSGTFTGDVIDTRPWPPRAVTSAERTSSTPGPAAPPTGSWPPRSPAPT